VAVEAHHHGTHVVVDFQREACPHPHLKTHQLKPSDNRTAIRMPNVLL
jgi:hypothetical protein